MPKAKEAEANEDKDKNTKETEPKKETPVFGTFGSSTTFGQGFGLLKEIQKRRKPPMKKRTMRKKIKKKEKH